MLQVTTNPASFNAYKKTKYPIRILEVGQGFDFPVEKMGSVRFIAHMVKTTTGRRFSVRKLSSTVARCGRIE